MTIVPVESERFETMEKVADLFMEGMNETQIARDTGLQRKVVKELLDDYKTALSNDMEARDMARDHLVMMGKHYDRLIAKYYDLIQDIDTLSFNHQVAGQKNAALKAIAELEAKRLDAFQKAGLLDSAELGDELAEMEEQREIILNILRNELCASCKQKVATQIARISGQVEVIDAEVIRE